MMKFEIQNQMNENPITKIAQVQTSSELGHELRDSRRRARWWEFRPEQLRAAKDAGHADILPAGVSDRLPVLY